MSFAGTFAAMAAAFSEVWFDAVAKWDGTPTRDDGGSITVPGTPITMACKVQFDVVTDTMRRDAEFKEKDVRILILKDGLTQPIDTNARIVVASGDYAGTWSLHGSVSTDPASIGYECRGRKWL